MTFFDTLPSTFAGFPTETIDTEHFTKAADGVVKLLDNLGSSVFSVVQKDISGNIAKVQARFDAAPEKSRTLEDLVKNEPADDKKRTATQGLLWLLRGLRFCFLALSKSLANPSEELSISFTNAYSESLSKFHNFVVRGLFSATMKACPYRAAFYEKLGAPLDVVHKQLGEWLAGLGAVLDHMEAFYKDGAYDKGL